METINSFTSSLEDIRETLSGSWGKDYSGNPGDCRIVYIQNIIIAQGDLEVIKKKISKQVYEWLPLGENLYLAFIK